jgi:hypothetical protein
VRLAAIARSQCQAQLYGATDFNLEHYVLGGLQNLATMLTMLIAPLIWNSL